MTGLRSYTSHDELLLVMPPSSLLRQRLGCIGRQLHAGTEDRGNYPILIGSAWLSDSRVQHWETLVLTQHVHVNWYVSCARVSQCGYSDGKRGFGCRVYLDDVWVLLPFKTKADG